MVNLNKLVVSIDLGGKEMEVGELISSEKKIYFKYFTSFISTGIQISPFKMPLSKNILTPDTDIFDGLFGAFNDSLPDGWGRLLLDRTLISRGISLNQIGQLDRLAFIGTGGMGALIYRPQINSNYTASDKLALDVIANEMNNVLEGTSSEMIEELFNLGGSSGGARPKIFVSYNPANGYLTNSLKKINDDFEDWIIKFPSYIDFVDIANIEYAYYMMALEAGIEMNECKLFMGNSGKHYFGTKRFDRINGKKIHLHSASGLMHDNYHLSSMDYGNLMDCAFNLENHINAYRKILRLAAFNVYGHNRDDHSKNFSFLMNEKGKWELSPAYDLTFSTSSHGWHSTMVAGESKAPGKKHLLELANHFSITNPNEIIDKVREAVSNWPHYASNCGVGKESTMLVQKGINSIKE